MKIATKDLTEEHPRPAGRGMEWSAAMTSPVTRHLKNADGEIVATTIAHPSGTVEVILGVGASVGTLFTQRELEQLIKILEQSK